MPRPALTGFSIRVEGVDSFTKALKKGEKQLLTHPLKELERAVAPVARDAEGLALGNIRNIGPVWSKFKTGVSVKGDNAFVYMAPKAKNTTGIRRPNLAPLLLERAMVPAMRHREAEIMRKLDIVVNRIVLLAEGRYYPNVKA